VSSDGFLFGLLDFVSLLWPKEIREGSDQVVTLSYAGGLGHDVIARMKGRQGDSVSEEFGQFDDGMIGGHASNVGGSLLDPCFGSGECRRMRGLEKVCSAPREHGGRRERAAVEEDGASCGM
jgi:hypothetical protein